jgi:hypothetical protein
MIYVQDTNREFDYGPDPDFEYYDIPEKGDIMREAHERGELYTFAQLAAEYGCTTPQEAARKFLEIMKAKRQTSASRPYQIPVVPAETLHVAEGCPVKYGGVRS